MMDRNQQAPVRHDNTAPDSSAGSGRELLPWFLGPLLVIAIGVAIVFLFLREDPDDTNAKAASVAPAAYAAPLS
jgi:hypothetical protein